MGKGWLQGVRGRKSSGEMPERSGNAHLRLILPLPFSDTWLNGSFALLTAESEGGVLSFLRATGITPGIALRSIDGLSASVGVCVSVGVGVGVDACVKLSLCLSLSVSVCLGVSLGVSWCSQSTCTNSHECGCVKQEWWFEESKAGKGVWGSGAAGTRRTLRGDGKYLYMHRH